MCERDKGEVEQAVAVGGAPGGGESTGRVDRVCAGLGTGQNIKDTECGLAEKSRGGTRT